MAESDGTGQDGDRAMGWDEGPRGVRVGRGGVGLGGEGVGVGVGRPPVPLGDSAGDQPCAPLSSSLSIFHGVHGG